MNKKRVKQQSGVVVKSAKHLTKTPTYIPPTMPAVARAKVVSSGIDNGVVRVASVNPEKRSNSNTLHPTNRKKTQKRY